VTNFLPKKGKVLGRQMLAKREKNAAPVKKKKEWEDRPQSRRKGEGEALFSVTGREKGGE